MRSTPSLSVRATLVVAAILPVALFTLGAAAVLYSVARAQLEHGVHTKLETVAVFLTQSTRDGLLGDSPSAVRESVLSALGGPRRRPRFGVRPGGRGAGRRRAIPGSRRSCPRNAASTARRACSGALGAAPAGAARDRALPGLARAARQRRRTDPHRDLHRAQPRGVPRAARCRARWCSPRRSPSASASPRRCGRACCAASTCSARTVRRVGAGDLGAQVPDLGAGELGDLGRSFNDMTRQLQPRARRARDAPGDARAEGRRAHHRARGGAQRRAAREPLEERLPGQHEPRDPHADDRDPGLRGPPARRRDAARRGAAAPARDRAPQRRPPARRAERHPRPVEDRGRPARGRADPDEPRAHRVARSRRSCACAPTRRASRSRSRSRRRSRPRCCPTRRGCGRRW